MSDFSNPHAQAHLILDSVRTNAFYNALQQVVTANDIVLDLGSGSGILACFAAKLGAKKVYAVERTSIANIITPIAMLNGQAHKITVLKTDILNYDWGDIQESPTVIVTETIGSFAPSESIHELLKGFFKHFSKNVKIIPCGYRLTCSFISLEKSVQLGKDLSDVQGLNFHPLIEQLHKTPFCHKAKPEEILTNEQNGVTISVFNDFPVEHEFQLKATNSGIATGICIGFELDVDERITIYNSPFAAETTWSHVILPLRAMERFTKDETFQCKLTFPEASNYETWTWQISKVSHPVVATMSNF